MIHDRFAIRDTLPPAPLDQCCHFCPLYPCELFPEYEAFIQNHRVKIYTDGKLCTTVNSLSYDKRDLDPCIIRTSTHSVPCGKKHVAEGIDNHYQIELTYKSEISLDIDDRWEPAQPVFISAQTGQGKNYFIENTLIPYVRELNHQKATNHKILIFSNRRALKKQLGSHMKSRSSENYFYPDDYVDIMVYQNLLNETDRLEAIQKSAKNSYAFVICDEAHFFSSDSSFNPYTQKILEKIVYLFRKSIRIYMSATPYDCLEHIIKQEKTSEKYNPLAFYHFDRDFSYLDIKTYTDHDELIPIIQESVLKKKERWLIFIDNIEGGKRFASKLTTLQDAADKRMETKVATLDSSKKQEPFFESIVINEALDKETFVLISTSVLDNGINLNNIDHIVASSMDKVQVLQMVGRARKTADDQRKTLYLKRPDKAQVERRILYLEEQKEAYHKFNMAYGTPSNPMQSRGFSTYNFQMEFYHGSQDKWEKASHWFGISKEDCKLHWNEISKSMLASRINQYKYILQEMTKEEIIGQKYLEHQLSWFNKTYSRDNDITYCDKEKHLKSLLRLLCQSYFHHTSFDTPEKREDFQKQFINLFDAAFYRADKNKRLYGAKKMNRLLTEEEIKFRIDGPPQIGPWKVILIDENLFPSKDNPPLNHIDQLCRDMLAIEIKRRNIGIANLIREKGDRYKFKKAKRPKKKRPKNAPQNTVINQSSKEKYAAVDDPMEKPNK